MPQRPSAADIISLGYVERVHWLGRRLRAQPRSASDTAGDTAQLCCMHNHKPIRHMHNSHIATYMHKNIVSPGNAAHRLQQVKHIAFLHCKLLQPASILLAHQQAVEVVYPIVHRNNSSISTTVGQDMLQTCRLQLACFMCGLRSRPTYLCHTNSQQGQLTLATVLSSHWHQIESA